MRDELLAFAFSRMGIAVHSAAPHFIDPDEAMELVWPINDLLLPHKAAIEGLPYYIDAERECDSAIMAFALEPRAPTLERMLSPEGWRVLHDRHVGFLTVAALNKAARNREFLVIPRGLPREDWLGALMLSFYLRFPREHLPEKPARRPRTAATRSPRRRKRAAAPGTPPVASPWADTRPREEDAARTPVALPATPPEKAKRSASLFRKLVIRPLKVLLVLFALFVALGIAGAWDPPAP
jgi:hypothetical protein